MDVFAKIFALEYDSIQCQNIRVAKANLASLQIEKERNRL